MPETNYEQTLVERFLQFGGVLLVVGIVTPLLYFYMQHGGHISAFFDDEEEVEIKFLDEYVYIDEKNYRIQDVRLYERSYGIFLVCGGVKVYCILNDNCKNIGDLIKALKAAGCKLG